MGAVLPRTELNFCNDFTDSLQNACEDRHVGGVSPPHPNGTGGELEVLSGTPVSTLPMPGRRGMDRPLLNTGESDSAGERNGRESAFESQCT